MVIAQLKGEDEGEFVDGMGKYERSHPMGGTWSNIVLRRLAPTMAGFISWG